MIDYLKIHFIISICNLFRDFLKPVSALSRSKFSLHKSIEE